MASASLMVEPKEISLKQDSANEALKSELNSELTYFPFLVLPVELQSLAIKLLDPLDILSLSLTCKQIHQECQRPSIWKSVCKRWWKDVKKDSVCVDWRRYFYYRNVFLHPTKSLVGWKAVTTSTIPSARQSLTGTYSRGKVIYIGGQTSVTLRYDDIFFFDPETSVFSRPKTYGEQPPKFARHTAAEIKNKIYLFGGYDGFGSFYGLGIFDLDTLTWSYPKTKGTPPIPRTNHAVTAVGKVMYLFGGNDTTRPGAEDLKWGTFGDFVGFDTETLTWFDLPPRGKPPSPRSGHHMVTIGKKIYLFGGGLWNDKSKSWLERYTDMFAYDTETGEWSEIPQQNVPGNAFISLPQWVVEGFIFVYNDPLYCFDTVTNCWSHVKTRGHRPQKRFLAPATYVPSRNCVFIFGGVYTQVMNYLDQLYWPTNIFQIIGKENGASDNES